MKYIVNNWKQNPETAEEARILFHKTAQATGDTECLAVITCPPHIYLAECTNEGHGSHFYLGAQNITPERDAKSIHALGASHVILGHSDWEKSETKEEIHKKIHDALANNLVPIVCVGEQTRDEGGAWKKELKEKLISLVLDIDAGDIARVIIAYEPIWAIGASADRVATLAEFIEAKEVIEDTFMELYNNIELVNTIPILYGGSINDKNIATFTDEIVDGLLLGRASLDIRVLDDIIHRFKRLCREHDELEYE